MDPVTPATEAAPTPATEQTLEQQLEAFVNPPAEALPTATSAKVPPPTEPTIDEQLAVIEDKPVVEAPKLTSEQEQILRIIPSAQAAQAMSEQLNGYTAFTSAFERGDFTAVESMFTNWNPEAFNGFLEHVYQSKVASGEWVDRWIADKEGNPTVQRGMKTLESKIASLESQLAQRRQSESQADQNATQQRTAGAYMKHIDTLFDQIKFSAVDRRWVTADIHNRVGADPNVRAAINSGNPAAVNSIFKSAVRDYVQRDKAAAAGQEAALKAQELKKPLVPTSPVTSLGALPSDVRQVPKGREDEWMNQELTALFSSSKK